MYIVTKEREKKEDTVMLLRKMTSGLEQIAQTDKSKSLHCYKFTKMTVRLK